MVFRIKSAVIFVFDGFLEDLRVSNTQELQEKIIQIMQNYNAEQYLKSVDYELSEQEFAQLLGRARLYQHLMKTTENVKKINEITFHFLIQVTISTQMQ